MVNLQYIELIINKCLTHAQIKEKLSEYTPNMRREILIYDNKLNPFELEEYDKFVGMMSEFDDMFSNLEANGYKSGDPLYDKYAKQKKEAEDRIFLYERRIIEKYVQPVKKVSDFDINNYNRDDADNQSTEVTGDIEQKMIDLQNQYGFNDSLRNSLIEWFGGGYWMINSSIYKGSLWSGLSKQEQNMKNKTLIPIKQNITKAINMSDGLVEPTILFKGTHSFDATLVPGDRIKFDGFVSASFKQRSASDFAHSGGFMYVLLTPTGKKGVCGNMDGLSQHLNEHEYLMGRGTAGEIVNIDYDTREVFVLVDE